MKKIIKADYGISNDIKMTDELVNEAMSLSDNLMDFLSRISKIENLSDYLDEYDIEDIQRTIDALTSIEDSYNNMQ